MPFLIWLPAAIGAIAWSIANGQLHATGVALFGGSGLLTWTLLEYLLHRFLFHPPERWPLLHRLLGGIHGKHHENPDHPAHALVPPVNAAVILLVLLGFFTIAIPTHALTIVTGFFLLGYLAYEAVHLAIHHLNPRTGWGRFLRRHHLWHHAHGREGNFGVTSPVWDWLLGTWRRSA